MLRYFSTALVGAVMAGSALAAPVHPTSYTMPNGGRGTFTYFDDSYDAAGALKTTAYATLSGGTGDLTDGVIAAQSWNIGGQTTSTPYVGWANINPVITFLFGQVTTFSSATFHFDGSRAGGVQPPQSVAVNGTLASNVTAPAVNAPLAHVVDLSSLAATDSLSFEITGNGNGTWIFVSEVVFEGAAPVPLPSSSLLLLGAFGGLAAWRRKRG